MINHMMKYSYFDNYDFNVLTIFDYKLNAQIWWKVCVWYITVFEDVSYIWTISPAAEILSPPPAVCFASEHTKFGAKQNSTSLLPCSISIQQATGRLSSNGTLDSYFVYVLVSSSLILKLFTTVSFLVLVADIEKLSSINTKAFFGSTLMKEVRISNIILILSL